MTNAAGVGAPPKRQKRRKRDLPQGYLLEPDERQLLEALLSHATCRVLRAGCWLPVPPDWRLRWSTPPNYTALLCVGGGAVYRIGGTPYAVRAGDLLLAPPHAQRTGEHDPDDPLHLYSVHFHARLYGVLDMPVVYRLPVYLRPTAARAAQMAEAAQRIVRELAEARPGHVLAANAACAELLALIWREAAASGSRGAAAGVAHAKDVTRLAPVFRLIEARHAEPLALRDLAAVVGLHPAYLSTVFRQAVGVPPLRYLGQFRLDRVRELLLTTELSMDQIARRTGFADPAYLSRAFRRAEGVSPTAYRRSKKIPSFS